MSASGDAAAARAHPADAAATVASTPPTVDAIVADHVARRAGLLAALTSDFEAFHAAADPARPPLSLSSTPGGAWALAPPPPTVPPSFPEPCPGINFARDGMERSDWAALVAVHADAWLRAVASFQAAAAGLGREGRAAHFGSFNAADTLYEELQARGRVGVSGGTAGRSKERPPGRALALGEVTPALRGSRAALFWPDSNEWFSVVISSVAPRVRSAKVTYDSGEVETLDLEEVCGEGHLVLTG